MKFRELEIGDLFTTTSDGFGVKQKLNNNALHNYVRVVKGVNSMESGLLGDYSRDGNVRKVRVKDDAFSIEERLTLGDLQVGQYFKEDLPPNDIYQLGFAADPDYRPVNQYVDAQTTDFMNTHAFQAGDPEQGWEKQCSVIAPDGLRHCGGYRADHPMQAVLEEK